jgi:hypothetical protein
MTGGETILWLLMTSQFVKNHPMFSAWLFMICISASPILFVDGSMGQKPFL